MQLGKYFLYPKLKKTFDNLELFPFYVEIYAQELVVKTIP